MTSTRIPTTDGLSLAAYRHSLDGDHESTRPTIVAVHGYPDNAGVWNALVPHLLPHADVVTYDVRGTGGSDEPRERSGFRLPQLVADLDAVVDWASRSGPVHLLAHDWGSIQAWQAVTDAGPASRVHSFTSISGPCLDHVDRWMRQGLRRGSSYRREALRQAAASSYIGFFKVRGLAEVAGSTGLLARLMSSASDTAELVPDFRRRRRDVTNGLELYRQNMLTRSGARKSYEPRTTSVPVQVITPTEDPYVRPAMGSCAQRFVPEVRLVSVEAGHWAIVTHPSEVAALVTGFVTATTR